MKRLLSVTCLLVASCAGAPSASLAPVGSPVVANLSTATPPGPAPALPRRETPDAPFRASAPLIAAATFTVPPLESFRLANGMRVLLLEQHGQPLIALRLVVTRGAPGAPGAATVLAATLDDGTSSRTGEAFRHERDAAGAQWNSWATVRTVEISVALPAPSLGAVLDLLADSTAHATLTASNVAWERDRIADRRTLDDERPDRIADRVAPMALYGQAHPDDQLETLRDDTFRAVKPEDVSRAYASAFVPSAATLVVVGGTTARELRPLVERAFGAWKGAPRRAAKLGGDVAAKSPRLVVIDRPRAADALVTWAAKVPEPGAPEWAALKVANELVGDKDTGVVGDALRSAGQQLWSWRTDIEPTSDGELQTWRTEVAFSSLESTLRLVENALRPLRETDTSATDLVEARAREARGALTWLSDQASTAHMIARLPMFNLPLDDLQTEPARVAAVTAAEVRRVASTAFDPARMKIVVIGDWNLMKDQLFALGWGPIEIRSADGDVLRVQSAP